MNLMKFDGAPRRSLFKLAIISAALTGLVTAAACSSGDASGNGAGSKTVVDSNVSTSTSADQSTQSSSEVTESESTTNATENGRKFKLLMAKALLSGPYLQTESCGMIDAANARGVDIEIVGPTDVDVQAQLNALETALVKKPDGVGISAFSATAFNATTQSLMSDGVPVISVGAPFTPEVEYMTIYTKADEVAKQLTPHIMGALPDKGKIAILASSPGNDIDEQRYLDLIKKIKAERPDVTVLDTQFTENETAKSQTTAAALIQANPDLSVIYATGDPSAAGVIAAVKSADMVGKIKIFAFDASPVEVQAVREGVVSAIAAQSPYLNGWMTVDALVDYLEAHGSRTGAVAKGDPFFEAVPAMVLTQENVDSEDGKKFHYEPSCDANSAG